MNGVIILSELFGRFDYLCKKEEERKKSVESFSRNIFNTLSIIIQYHNIVYFSTFPLSVLILLITYNLVGTLK